MGGFVPLARPGEPVAEHWREDKVPNQKGQPILDIAALLSHQVRKKLRARSS